MRLRVFITLVLATAIPACAQAQFVTAGEAGFVVSFIEFALAPDARESGACPSGMTLGPREIWAKTPQGKRRPGESDSDYSARQGALFMGAAGEQNPCLHPGAWPPDPYFRTVESSAIPVDGIDLDGEVSSNDFPGLHGEKGVDNQFYRLVGCSRSFQSTGPSNTFGEGILTGSAGMLLTLRGVDNIRNDDSVEVGFFDNNDPIRLSPIREPLEYATYALYQDPRFRAVAPGRIKDGVLTTEPTDMRFRLVVNNIRLERPLKDGRLRATLSEDGVLEGYLAGYTPVEDLYDLQYGFRNGKDGAGKPSPLRLLTGSSNGQAFVLGHTCHGAYYAMHELADGHPDPVSGEFTSISTQYRLKAIPAFVVDVETQSTNEELDKHSAYANGN